MKITNRLSLPAPFVRAVSTERHNAPNCLSATTLLKGAKEIVLAERHWDEMTDDAADRVWAVFGSAVHSVLESHAGAEEFAEHKVSAEVDGVTVTGQVDYFSDGVIHDYKTASVWKVLRQEYEDWRRQGQIYAWLLAQNGIRVSMARFVILLKDHSKTKARADKSYPRSPCAVFETDISDEPLAETERFIRAKVEEYKIARELGDNEIMPCSDKERWSDGWRYAVRMPGKPRAMRVFEDEAVAQVYSEAHPGSYVETREPVYRKCVDYCPVRQFCNFYHRLMRQEV